MLATENMKQIRFTQEGYEKLKKEHDDLLKARPMAVSELAKARAMGDLKENGFYKAARMQLSSIDADLRRFSGQLKQAVIVVDTNPNAVAIGKRVTLLSGRKKLIYQIVGDLEANPSQGKISLLSPIGRAIFGKKTNDKVQINTPSGKILYKIIAISS